MEKKPLVIFLFFLFIIFFSSYNVKAEEKIDVSGSGIGPFQDYIHFTIPYTLSANSYIPTVQGEIYGYTVGYGFQPDGARYQLKNPVGEIIYEIEANGDFSTTPDIPDWWPFPYPGYTIFRIQQEELYVPCFPMRGTWKVELILYDTTLGFFEKNAVFADWSFTVGESDILANLMAPIYVHADIIPFVYTINFMLPGIIWLSSPIWMILAIGLLIKYWKQGITGTVKILKKKTNNNKVKKQ